MGKSGCKDTRKLRGFGVSTIAVPSTFDAARGIADMLRSFTAKAVARRVGTSPRTVENWKDGVNAPTWRHVVAMLNDDELAPELLRAAGREDLAKQHEILSLERRIDALKQAENRLEEDIHDSKRDLAAAREPLPVGGGAHARGRPDASAGRPVVQGASEVEPMKR